MDTITHGLLGGVVAQLGFRERIGRDATWAAVAAAVVPDLDIFIAPIVNLTGAETDGFAAVSSHRGVTHSFLVIPLIALAAAGLWWWFRRKAGANGRSVPFWLLYLGVLLPMCTHPLLDAMTSYGTQLLAPLTNHRFAIDAVPIVDIIYTPILILTLLGCYLARKRRPDGPRAGLRIGWIGFAISVAYLAAGVGFNQLVISRMRHVAGETCSTRGGSPGPAEYRAYPQLGTIFVWRGTRHCPDSWTTYRLNILYGADPATGESNTVQVVEDDWIRRARQLPPVRTFEWFALGQTRATSRREDGRHVVEFMDMRYGLSPASPVSIWSLRAVFDPALQSWEVEMVHPHRRAGLGTLARRSVRDIVRP